MRTLLSNTVPLAVVQGCDFQEGLRSSDSIERVRARLRADVPTMKGDRHMARDMEAAIAIVRSGELLDTLDLPGVAP